MTGDRAESPGGDQGRATATDRTTGGVGTVLDGVEGIPVRRDGGSGRPPLLLINSLGTDRSSWDRPLPFWSPYLEVLRYDQRGHGATRRSTAGMTLADLGRDALEVLDAAGAEQAMVCGCSLGGLVAQWVAIHAPERVASLVLADTAARVGTADAWQQRAAVVRHRGMDAVAAQVIERFFSGGFRVREARVVAEVERRLRAQDPEGYAASCEVLAGADLRADVSAVRAPTLVIVGDEDVATPLAQARDLAASIPGAELVQLPGAGHLAPIEQPGRFAGLVLGGHPDPTVRSAVTTAGGHPPP